MSRYLIRRTDNNKFLRAFGKNSPIWSEDYKNARVFYRDSEIQTVCAGIKTNLGIDTYVVDKYDIRNKHQGET